jgi:hypothetical protein
MRRPRRVKAGPSGANRDVSREATSGRASRDDTSSTRTHLTPENRLALHGRGFDRGAPLCETINGQAYCPAAAWNRGKLIGSKPPPKVEETWSVRARLKVADRIRDLALFNLALH